MNKVEIKAKWLHELRHGNHTQVPGTLKGKLPDGGVGYCCLGVLEEKVLGNELSSVELIPSDDEDDAPDWYKNEGPETVYEKLRYDILGPSLVSQVSRQNDEGWTFPEIANYIEHEWVVE